MNSFLQKTALILFGAALALLISETALRVFHLPHVYKFHTEPGQFYYKVGPLGIPEYVNKPSAEIEFIYDGNPRGYFGMKNEIVHHTNSWGFRGKEFSIEKPNGVYRIAFLGDSFTFGEGVRDEDAYPEVVSKILNAKFQDKGLQFESLNFGVGGYNIEDSLYLLEQFGLNTNPDVIVLGYVLNDAEPRMFQYNPETGKVTRRLKDEPLVPQDLDGQRLPVPVLNHLRTFRWLWNAFQTTKFNHDVVKYYLSLYEDSNPNWQANRTALKKMEAICREKSIHCYVLCFPILYKLGDNYPFKPIHEKVRAEVENQNSFVHWIDLFDYLKGMRLTDLWVHPTDNHPNEVVHKIAAEVLAEKILSELEFKKKQ